MHRFKHAVVCCLALLAFGAVAASAASAAPEFKNAEGKVPTKTGITTTSKAGSPAPVLSGGGVIIRCSTESSKGKITGASTVGSTIVTYTGCKAETSSKSSCGEAKTKGGTTKEEIKTKKLKGSLGTVPTEQAASGVGQRLEPESGAVFVEVEFEKSCNFLTSTKVEGRVIGEATPVHELKTEGSLIFAGSGGHQKINTFEGSTENNVLKAFGFAESVLESEETVKFEEPVEVT